MIDASPTVEVLLAQALTAYRDGEIELAETLYGRVLLCDPGNAHAMHILGLIAHQRQDRPMAVALMERAAAIAPHSRVQHNLGVVLYEMGEFDRAITGYRQALAMEPDYIDAAANLLFTLDMHPHATHDLLKAERQAFDAQFCAPLILPSAARARDRSPERRLKVGYVSGDFRRHSASMSFLNVICGHDEAQVEVYLYSTAPKHDSLSEVFKAKADVWCEVAALDPAELAAVIQEDQIDVLVDLAGFSRGHRIQTFAMKPAPIQVSGWGYANGMGLSAIDYLVADDVAMPDGHESRYPERLMRLPCVLSYAPEGAYPPITAPPQERNGYRTYGYLGRAVKLNPPVLATWASILRQDPTGRLLLKHPDYRDRSMRDRVGRALVALGVDPSRIEVRADSNRYDHLAAYNLIDVALDTFPANGGMTTADALLMGVPTVTLSGTMIQGRIGASLMSGAGYDDWIVSSVEGYVAAATALDLPYRPYLREALLGSIITHPTDYSRAFEAALRVAWRQWCSERKEVAA